MMPSLLRRAAAIGAAVIAGVAASACGGGGRSGGQPSVIGYVLAAATNKLDRIDTAAGKALRALANMCRRSVVVS